MDAFDKDRDGKIAIGDFAATVGISMSSGKRHIRRNSVRPFRPCITMLLAT